VIFEGTVFLLTAGVEDGVDFILFSSFDCNGRGLVVLGLGRQGVVGASPEFADVEDWMDFHGAGQVEFKGRGTHFIDYLEWAKEHLVDFLAWVVSRDGFS
jgi:hypothetical protein